MEITQTIQEIIEDAQERETALELMARLKTTDAATMRRSWAREVCLLTDSD